MTRSTALRVLTYSLITLAVVVLLLVTATGVMIGTEPGRMWLVEKGVEQANKTDLDVRVQGLRSPKLGRWRVAELAVDRAGKPLLRITNFQLMWRPRALLQKTVQIDRLTAARLHLYASESNKDPAEPDNDEPGGLPNLPEVILSQLRVGEFALHPATPDAPAIPHFTIEGAARLFSEDFPLQFNLLAQALGDDSTRLDVDSRVLSRDEVQIRGTLAELAGGWVGGLLRLPEDQALDAAFTLSVARSGQSINLAVNSLALPLGPHQLGAAGGLSYDASTGKLDVPELALDVDGAKQVLRGAYSAEHLWLEARLQSLPLILVQNWVPEFENGTLSGTLQGNWSPQEENTWPSASAQLVLNMVVSGQATHADIAGDLENKRLQLQKARLRSGDTELTAAGLVDFFGDQNSLTVTLNNFSTALLEPWPIPLPEGLFVQSPRTHAVIHGAFENPRIQIESQANGQYNQQTFRADLAARGDKSGGEIAHLRAQLADTHLDASGRVDLTGDQNNLRAELKNFDTALLKAFAVPLPDTLAVKSPAAKAVLTGSLEDPQLALEVRANGEFQQQAFSGDISGQGNKQRAQFSRLQLAAGEARLNARGSVDLENETADVQLDFQRLTEALLNFLPADTREGLPDELHFDAEGKASVRGALTRPEVIADLHVDGRYDLVDETIPFDLALQGGVQVGPLDELELVVERLAFDLFDERALELEGSYSLQKMDLRARIDRLPTRALAALGAPMIDGDARADLALTGSLAMPRLDGSITYTDDLQNNLQSQQPVPVSWETQFTSGDNLLDVAMTFRQSAEVIGNMNLQLPLAAYLNAINEGEPLPLQARIQANLDLAVSQLFLTDNIHQLVGQLTTDLELAGTVEQPLINGQLSWLEGYYSNALTGTSLRQIALVLTGEGQRITVEQANLRTSGRGSVSAAGQVNWGAAQRILNDAVNLTLSARNAELIERPDVQGAVQGELSLRGSFEDLWLRGEIEVSPLNVNLDSAIRTSIPEIEVTEIDASSELEATEQASAMPRIRLDLVISTDDQAYLRGRGLDTGLTGRIRLGGSLDEPEYIGQFNTVRGRMDILGKTFVLENGQVRFSNEVIGLNIPGTHRSRDGNDGVDEYRLELSGTADDPQIKLSSVPALPEDEIISRLLFGRSIQALTEIQALQLANEIRSLASGGGGGGFDPVGSARDILGVDSLNIGTDEGGLSLGVGKHVNDRVYVEVGRSATTGARNTTGRPPADWQGSVQVELSPRWTLKGGSGEFGGGSAELLWKRDY